MSFFFFFLMYLKTNTVISAPAIPDTTTESVNSISQNPAVHSSWSRAIHTSYENAHQPGQKLRNSESMEKSTTHFHLEERERRWVLRWCYYCSDKWHKVLQCEEHISHLKLHKTLAVSNKLPIAQPPVTVQIQVEYSDELFQPWLIWVLLEAS